MSNEISAPITALINRLKYHKSTGFTPVGGSLTKILGDFLIVELPETRGQWDKDLPAIGISLGGGSEDADIAKVFGATEEVQIELFVKRLEGLGAAREKLEKVLDALRTNNQGRYDPTLDSTLNKPIKISWGDDVAYQGCLTTTISVEIFTKPYRQTTL